MSRAQRIHTILTQNFAPSHLEVRDVSHKHLGHAGARPEGETHYEITIKAAAFHGMNRVQRHQAIYKTLAEEFQAGLHAVGIEATS